MADGGDGRRPQRIDAAAPAAADHGDASRALLPRRMKAAVTDGFACVGWRRAWRTAPRRCRGRHAFAGEAGEAGRGSGIGADPTEGRGDGRPRDQGGTDGDGRRPDATDAALSSHLVLPDVLPDIPHGDDDRPRDRDDRDYGSHGDREEPRAAAPGPALFEADLPLVPGRQPRGLSVADRPPLRGGRRHARQHHSPSARRDRGRRRASTPPGSTPPRRTSGTGRARTRTRTRTWTRRTPPPRGRRS